MRKILVVDDDIHHIERLELILSQIENTRTIQGTDGVEGFNLYASEQPDVILTDLVMPNLDGLEMIKQIRELDSEIPIIAFSGFIADDGYKLENIYEAGADDAIPKPSMSQSIINTVMKHLDLI